MCIHESLATRALGLSPLTTTNKVNALIYWNNEDGAFVAEAPELPGCPAHGDTQEAALEHISQAVDLWLGDGAGVRRPDSRTEGRAPDAGMTRLRVKQT